MNQPIFPLKNSKRWWMKACMIAVTCAGINLAISLWLDSGFGVLDLILRALGIFSLSIMLAYHE